MVLVPLEHGLGPVQHHFPPFGIAARHIPAGLDGIRQCVLLPGAVGFQIGFVHQVDALPVAHMVPFGAVGVVAGTHRVHIVGHDGFHGLFHVGNIDGPALFAVPFMTVDTVDHQPSAV